MPDRKEYERSLLGLLDCTFKNLEDLRDGVMDHRDVQAASNHTRDALDIIRELKAQGVVLVSGQSTHSIAGPPITMITKVDDGDER